MYTKEQVLDILQAESVVSFTKVDGSERKMRCTLNPLVIPKSEDKTEKTMNLNESQIRVWDLDSNGWRSFRLDSIKEILWQ